MEQILVVRRSEFFAGDWPQGVTPLAPRAARELAGRFAARAFFTDRAPAERDRGLKQPIPYCVVRRGGEVLCVERLRAQGETRLHGKLSVGLGGHVNPEDGPVDPGVFERCLRRELDEELALPSAVLPAPTLVALLNDDSDPVGAVHAGFVHVLEVPPQVPRESIQVREMSKMRGGFRCLVDPRGLWQDLDKFESWSALLLTRLLVDTARMEVGAISDGSQQAHGREESHDGGTQDGPGTVP